MKVTKERLNCIEKRSKREMEMLPNVSGQNVKVNRAFIAVDLEVMLGIRIV
jgi:hypothetical protein